jgi:uncharacterized phage infection (PIP) family protein YhgE
MYKDKTVLITGHTGFKGVWLSKWLKLLGAKVHGVSLDPPTNPSHFSAAQLANEINDLRNEIVNLKKDNNNLLGQIQILKESLTNLEKYLRSNNFDLNQSIDKLNKAIGDLSNKLSDSRNGVQNSTINNKEVQNTDNSNTKDKVENNYVGQCKGVTKKGTRCSRAGKSNGYCWQHGGS